MVPDSWLEREWDPPGWEGHELAQRRRFAKLPFSEKLAWLEEAQDLLETLREQQARKQNLATILRCAMNSPGEEPSEAGG